MLREGTYHRWKTSCESEKVHEIGICLTRKYWNETKQKVFRMILQSMD